MTWPWVSRKRLDAAEAALQRSRRQLDAATRLNKALVDRLGQAVASATAAAAAGGDSLAAEWREVRG